MTPSMVSKLLPVMDKITINWLPVWLPDDHLKDRGMPLAY
jgi:hypothetical protein